MEHTSQSYRQRHCIACAIIRRTRRCKDLEATAATRAWMGWAYRYRRYLLQGSLLTDMEGAWRQLDVFYYVFCIPEK